MKYDNVAKRQFTCGSTFISHCAVVGHYDLTLAPIYLSKKTAVPTTTMSSTPSKTEFVSILDCNSTADATLQCYLPQTDDGVCPEVNRLLPQLPQQLLPDIHGQLRQALHLPAHQRLEP